MRLKDLLSLMRVKQWYKNLVIFLPLIFSKQLFNANSVVLSVLGFFSLCLISSMNYVLNDLLDYEKDKVHPEKKHRVLVSGRISLRAARILVILLFISSISFSFLINEVFFVWPLLLFFSTLLYSIKVKKVPFLDLQFISLNFIIRTISGMHAVSVGSSPWLLVMVYLLALLLGISKRLSDLRVLGENAIKHKSVYAVYSEELLKNLLVIVIAMILSTYCFYTFLAETTNNVMMLTIPVVVFILQRYLYLVLSNHKAGRNAELILFDAYIVISVILWLLISIISFYLV